jgi:SAM-dependent methyltransferase
MTVSFEQSREQWRVLPVDDYGYVDASTLLDYSDADLVALVDKAEAIRYNPQGYRNWDNGWQRGMHDGLTGRTVLDFGCGIGLEARRLARAGNSVIVADINPHSAGLACYVLELAGITAEIRYIYGDDPYVSGATFDVFFSNGVLHHIPYAADVLAWAGRVLPDNGEMRLMVYTDKARDRAIAQGKDFAASMDFFGAHCDWYDEAKMAGILPAGWTLDRWEYITMDGAYATARVVKA